MHHMDRDPLAPVAAVDSLRRVDITTVHGTLRQFRSITPVDGSLGAARTAGTGDMFCTVHRDAINGVMMGILHHTEPYHVTKEQIGEACLEDARVLRSP